MVGLCVVDEHAVVRGLVLELTTLQVIPVIQLLDFASYSVPLCEMGCAVVLDEVNVDRFRKRGYQCVVFNRFSSLGESLLLLWQGVFADVLEVCTQRRNVGVGTDLDKLTRGDLSLFLGGITVN